MSYMPRINSLKERDSVSGPTAYFLGFPAMCHAMEIRVGRVTIRTCVGISQMYPMETCVGGDYIVNNPVPG